MKERLKQRQCVNAEVVISQKINQLMDKWISCLVKKEDKIRAVPRVQTYGGVGLVGELGKDHRD